MKLKLKRQIQAGTLILLIIYIAVLFYVCFLSEVYGRDEITDYYRYNLIPFKEITRFFIYRDVVGIPAFILNLFGNVIAFMPFAFFIPILSNWNRNIYHTVCATFLLSLLIECVQLITRVGSFDIDDLILNTLGGVLGYFLFYIMNTIRRRHYGS